MNNHPKLAYGVSIYNRSTDTNDPIVWFDTLKESEGLIENKGYPQSTILVYGLSACLTTIRYIPYGIAQGYHYFGIHPDHIGMASRHGINDDVILEKVSHAP